MSIAQIAPAAFLAGWAHSVSELPTRFPHLCDEVMLSPGTYTSLICDNINQAIKSFITKSTLNSSRIFQIIHRSFNISFLLHETNDHVCLDIATQTSDRDAARIRSLQRQGADSWLETIPTEEAVTQTQQISFGGVPEVGHSSTVC